MSRARDTANLGSTDLATQVELDAVAAATFDDSNLRHDLATIALNQVIGDNLVAYSLSNSVIDQFEDISGIKTGTGSGTPGDSLFWDYQKECFTPQFGYDQPSWKTASRTIAMLSSNGWFPSTAVATGAGGLFDGNLYGGRTTATVYPAADTSAWYMTIDLGSTDGPTTKTFGYRFYGKNANAAATSVYGSILGSTDNSIFVPLAVPTVYDLEFSPLGEIGPSNAGGGTSFVSLPDIDGSLQEITWGNEKSAATIPYRHLKFLVSSGGITTNGDWRQITFKQSTQQTRDGDSLTFSVGDGSIISALTTASSSRTKVSGVLYYKNAVGTAALSTNIEVQFTCDGTNYTTAASYTVVNSGFSDGILIKLGETTCSHEGTSIGWKVLLKVQAAASMVTELHGIGLNY